jgi:hypothetical protein
LKCAQSKDLHYAPAQAEDFAGSNRHETVASRKSQLYVIRIWSPANFSKSYGLLGRNPKAAPFEAPGSQNNPGALSRAFDPRNAQPKIHSAVQPPSIE